MTTAVDLGRKATKQTNKNRIHVAYFISKLTVLVNRYQDPSLSGKRIYQFVFKFLLIIHAHLHLQNSMYIFELFTSYKEMSCPKS